MGCYEGHHKIFGKVVVIDYAGDFLARGKQDPILLEAQKLAEGMSDFQPTALRAKAYTDKVEVKVMGTKATKTTKRSYKFYNGTGQEAKMVEEHEFKY